jgi:hypothetical protein
MKVTVPSASFLALDAPGTKSSKDEMIEVPCMQFEFNVPVIMSIGLTESKTLQNIFGGVLGWLGKFEVFNKFADTEMTFKGSRHHLAMVLLIGLVDTR